MGNSGHVVVSVSMDFLSISKTDALFHCTSCDYSQPDCGGLLIHLIDVPCQTNFKLGAFVAAADFCELVRVRIAVYIPYRKYQIKPHSYLWFTATCAATEAHRTHTSCLYLQNKSSASKVKIRQASQSLFRNLAFATFGEYLIMFLSKVNQLYLLYLTAPRCCFLCQIKQNCLLKHLISKNS